MDTPSTSTTEEIIRRIQCEFLEMPGLRLTEQQACRLWALDPLCCSAVLSVLIKSGFLFRTRNGAFMRADRAVPEKVDLPAATGPRARATAA